MESLETLYKLNKARTIAKQRGIEGTITLSNIKGKRFKITLENGKTIHFGSDKGKTFLDHKDEQKKKAWQARHSKIMRDGKPAYKDKQSPAYYSYNILW